MKSSSTSTSTMGMILFLLDWAGFLVVDDIELVDSDFVAAGLGLVSMDLASGVLFPFGLQI